MLDLKGIEEYWKKQTEKGDNPCHYHNKWQDRYAYHVRSHAFRRKDFVGAKEIVDVGCGIGEYTMYIANLAPEAHVTAFDFPFNIAIAQKQNARNSKITYISATLPDSRVVDAIQKADVAYTTTVYVHLAEDARRAFFEGCACMKKGARVMLLEYMPDTVPSFQKGLPYKEVETPKQITEALTKYGFVLKKVRPVNFIDSFMFHHMGANAVSYWLTRILELPLYMFPIKSSKYKLMIFEKQ